MKAAIFDIDGTLIDSVDYHAQAWQHAFKHFGFPQTFEAVRSQIGKGGDQLMPVFLPKKVIKERGGEIQKYSDTIFKQYFMHRVKPFPDVRALFERLSKAGIRVALASSAKEEELKVYKNLCRISDLVDAETSSDDADRSKPHPDIFKAVLKRLKGIKAQDCVVIGDSPFDASAAQKAKMKVIGVLCGGFPEKDLWEAGCAEIYKDPSDLLQKIENSIFGEEESASS